MKLLIITGPPGSGKTTYAKEINRKRRDSVPSLPEMMVYDTDLGNKNEWSTHSTRKDVLSGAVSGDCILMTSAPSAKNKAYWLSIARTEGFEPKLLAIVLPRMLCYARMKSRDGLSPTQRNDLEKDIERWYRRYQRHPQERVYSGE